MLEFPESKTKKAIITQISNFYELKKEPNINFKPRID